MGNARTGVVLPPAEEEVQVVDTTTENNNETVDEQQNENGKITKVNGMEFPAERVNRFKTEITSTTYKVSEDEDTADSYIWGTKDAGWGSYREDENATWEIVNNSHNIIASSYGVNAVFEADMVFKHILPQIAVDAKTLGPEEYERLHKHTYDKLVFSFVQIHVPAHTDFVSPYTRSAKPKPKRYDQDYVFTYVEKIQFNPKNINHKQMLKNIYKNFDICPEDFIDALIDEGYFVGNIDDSMRERLYKSMEFKK